MDGFGLTPGGTSVLEEGWGETAIPRMMLSMNSRSGAGQSSDQHLLESGPRVLQDTQHEDAPSLHVTGDEVLALSTAVWIYAATMAYSLTLTTPHSITLHHPIPHHTTTHHATPHHTQALELMDTAEDVPQVSVLGSALSFQCLPVCVSSYQYFSADISVSSLPLRVCFEC